MGGGINRVPSVGGAFKALCQGLSVSARPVLSVLWTLAGGAICSQGPEVVRVPLDLQAQAWKHPGILPEELEEAGDLDISASSAVTWSRRRRFRPDRTQYPGDLNS